MGEALVVTTFVTTTIITTTTAVTMTMKTIKTTTTTAIALTATTRKRLLHQHFNRQLCPNLLYIVVHHAVPIKIYICIFHFYSRVILYSSFQHILLFLSLSKRSNDKILF